MAIRIVLADDHKMIRDGLCSLLSENDHMEVIGEAADGKEAVKLVKNCHRTSLLLISACRN